jgi:hypothetical protein
MGFDGVTGYINFGTHTGNGYRDNILQMRGSDGYVGVGTSQLTSQLIVGEYHGVKLSVGGTSWANKNIIQTNWISGIGDFTEINVVGKNANNASIRLIENGNVGIGTTTPSSKLTVAGDINAREVRVTVNAGADFVFENEYNLPSLTILETYIKDNKHLPEIESAKEMEERGINLSEMNIKLLQKIEELTLYTIEQHKENNIQSKKIEELSLYLIQQNKDMQKLKTQIKIILENK